MNEQIFRIRPYSKRELAGLYFPLHEERRYGREEPEQPDAPQSGLAGRTGGSPLHHILPDIHTSAGAHHRALSGRALTRARCAYRRQSERITGLWS